MLRFGSRLPGGSEIGQLGLDAFDRELWPPIAVVHVAFQIMVACGGAMLALAGGGGLLWLLGRTPWANPWFLRAAALATPLGLIAIEAGWTVTEVGRQPWVVVGVMRTKDAVTHMPGLVVPLFAFTILYAFLGVIVVVLLRRHVLAVERPEARSE